MKENTGRWETVLVTVCLILSALLAGRMLLHTDLPLHAPHSPVQRADTDPPRTLALTGDGLTSLLVRQLPEGFPLHSLTVTVGEGGIIGLSGTLPREAVQALDGLPGAAAALLPAQCTVQAVLSVGLDAAAGQLILQPTALTIGGLRVPAEVLEALTGRAAQAIASGLRDQGIVPSTVRTEQGRLILGV